MRARLDLLEVDEIDHKHGGEERGALSGIGLFGEHDVEIVRVGVQRSTTSLRAPTQQQQVRACVCVCVCVLGYPAYRLNITRNKLPTSRPYSPLSPNELCCV